MLRCRWTSGNGSSRPPCVTSGSTSRRWATTRARRSAGDRQRRRLLPRGREGKRYLDALAGLFCVNIGYGYGEEMGEAAAAQMRELPFAINWTFAHPRSIELAAEVAGLAPGDLKRCFFVSGGSEAVEAAWKLARQYHNARGERRWKAIGRRVAYHGTTMGALSINGMHGPEDAVRAARARRPARVQHQPLPPPARGDRGGVHELPARRARRDDRCTPARARSRW